MSKATIAFFGTMPYDKATFKAVNEQYGFDIKFYTRNLSQDNQSQTRDADAVCVFVNDNVDAELILRLKEHGVRLIALRCAGSTTWISLRRNVLVLLWHVYLPIHHMPWQSTLLHSWSHSTARYSVPLGVHLMGTSRSMV